jgi:hypothetical protein
MEEELITPVANNDTAITQEDTSIVIDVLDNDSDPNNNLDVSTVTLVANPNNGTFILIPTTGEIVYTPNADFFGTDSFTYTVQDTNGGTSNTETFDVTINPVNDNPVANNDNGLTEEATSYITDEDTPITINVLENDVDIDSEIDPTTVTVTEENKPSNGTVSINRTTGQITYTPDDNFFGTDNFYYTVNDAEGGTSNIGTVNITVNSVNDSPVVNDDTAITEANKSVIINVLNNDSDAENEIDPRTIVLDTGLTNATVKFIAATGEIIYTPNTDTTGFDSFRYTVKDINGAISNVGTVEVEVTPENLIDDPLIDNNDVTTLEDTSIIVDIFEDLQDRENPIQITDINQIQITNNPSEGTVFVNEIRNTLTNEISAEIIYTPDSNFFGDDSFSYQINTLTETIIETVRVTVDPVNDVPIANNDSVTTDEDTQVIIPVLDNDFDAENQLDAGTVTVGSNIIDGVETNPRHGEVSINSSTGRITYTPDENFVGTDSFTYTVEDENGEISNIARVDVTVNPVNDIPVAQNDTATTEENTSVVINVLDNDSDAENEIDITTVQIDTLPTRGTVEVIATTGEIIYTPNVGFLGDDSFTYTVSEINDEDDTNNIANGETSNVATVNISVTEVNDIPVANNDTVTLDEDSSFVINVLENDVDSSLDVTTVQIDTNPNNGTVSVNSETGEVTYTPNSNFFGSDSFTYTVADTNGAVSNVGTVDLTVNSVNDLPVANNDTVTTLENQAVVINVLDNDSDVENEIDPTTVVIDTNPGSGTVSINSETGEITYTPNTDFSGSDSFRYTVEDVTGGISNIADVTVNVNPDDPNNTPPVANDDTVNTAVNSSIVIDVLDNDQDVDDNIDITSVVIANDPENGTVELNSETGEVTYTPDSDFIGSDSFIYTVKDAVGATSNTANVNIIVNQVSSETANFNNIQVLSLGGNAGQTKQIKISFVSENTELLNEIGVFKVDDEQGTVNGVSPEDSNYLQTALENSQVIFSSLPNNVLEGVEFSRQLEFDSSDRLVFYLVQNSTTQTVISNLAAGGSGANVLFALPDANNASFNPLQISDLDGDNFSLSWKDRFSSNSRFDNLVMDVEILDTDITAVGTGLQGEIELIDLRGLTLEANFAVASEAAYNNTVGWYVVDDETGRIGNLNPGDAGYAQAAIADRSITHFTREGIDSAQLSGLLAPYLIADSSRDNFLANNPNNLEGNGPIAYFAFLAANPDGVDHIRQLGDNTFGFEDLFNGGDNDFNDIIMQVTFA